METFWSTIADYNRSTFAIQVLLTVAAAAVTAALFLRPSRGVRIAVKTMLVILNLWIAVVYYGIFCAPRDYNAVMAIFWSIMALVWGYDLLTGYTTFERTRRHRILPFVLLLVPLAYPLCSIARGMEFPTMTTPVMPCCLAVYTIGLMLAFSRRVNIFVVLLLCHWALLGLSKAYFYRIPEDYLLAACTVPALYLFLREYIRVNAHGRTKPGAGVLNALLLVVCGIIGAMFTAAVIRQLTL